MLTLTPVFSRILDMKSVFEKKSEAFSVYRAMESATTVAIYCFNR